MPFTPSLTTLDVTLKGLESSLSLLASLPSTIIRLSIEAIEVVSPYVTPHRVLLLLRAAVSDREIDPDIEISDDWGNGEEEGVGDNADESQFKILPSLKMVHLPGWLDNRYSVWHLHKTSNFLESRGVRLDH